MDATHRLPLAIAALLRREEMGQRGALHNLQRLTPAERAEKQKIRDRRKAERDRKRDARRKARR